jgi:flagellar motor switch protein FliM
VRAGTQERFIGHPGRVAGNLAVRVLDTVRAAPIVPDPRTYSA